MFIKKIHFYGLNCLESGCMPLGINFEPFTVYHISNGSPLGLFVASINSSPLYS